MNGNKISDSSSNFTSCDFEQGNINLTNKLYFFKEFSMKLEIMKRFYSAALLIAIFVSFNAYAADKVNTKECKIQTSVASGHCKAKVMNGLKDVSGVVKSDVSLTSKVLTVKYDPNKTSPAKIATKVQTLGYTASVVKEACCDKTKTAPKAKTSCCDKTKKTSCSPKAKASCSGTAKTKKPAAKKHEHKAGESHNHK